MKRIESLFGDVTASVKGDGKIMVTDNTTGTSSLAVKIAVKNNGGTDDDTLSILMRTTIWARLILDEALLEIANSLRVRMHQLLWTGLQ